MHVYIECMCNDYAINFRYFCYARNKMIIIQTYCISENFLDYRWDVNYFIVGEHPFVWNKNGNKNILRIRVS